MLNTEQLRARMAHLVKMGVTKRHIGDRLGVHETWVGRFIDGTIPKINLEVAARFVAYEQDLCGAPRSKVESPPHRDSSTGRRKTAG